MDVDVIVAKRRRTYNTKKYPRRHEGKNNYVRLGCVHLYCAGPITRGRMGRGRSAVAALTTQHLVLWRISQRCPSAGAEGWMTTLINALQVHSNSSIQAPQRAERHPKLVFPKNLRKCQL